jgi:pentatricopeptide repeat protein
MHTLIFMFARVKMYEKAVEFFADMKRLRLKPAQTLVNCMLGIYCKMGDEAACIAFWRDMEHVYGFAPDTAAYNMVITMYAQEGKVDKMWDVFRAMEGRDKTPDQPLPFTSALVSHVVPDAATYSTVVAAIARPGGEAYRTQWPRLLADMQRHQFKPAPTLYASVMMHHLSLGELDRVLELFAQMKAENYSKPHLFGYYAVMRVYLKRKDLSGVKKLFQELKDYNTEPDDRIYNVLLQAHASQPQPNEREIMTTLQQMRALNFAVEPPSCHLLMLGYTRARQLEAVIKLYKFMQDEPNAGELIDGYCLSAVFFAYCRVNDMPGAKEFFSKFPEHGGIRSNHITAIFGLCLRTSDEVHALQYYELAKSLEIPLNEDNYSALIQLFAASRAKEMQARAHAFLLEMKQKGRVCPKAGWTALIKLYAQNGQLQEMMQLYALMKVDAIEEERLRDEKELESERSSSYEYEELLEKAKTPSAPKSKTAKSPKSATNTATTTTTTAKSGSALRLFLSMLRGCLESGDLAVSAEVFREMERCELVLGYAEIASLCTLYNTRPQDEAFFWDLVRLINTDNASNSVLKRVATHLVELAKLSAAKEGERAV